VRGWVNYFRYVEVKGIFEELDGWLRRNCGGFSGSRGSVPIREPENLMRRGLSEATA
jgi:RNA-directed DNA polymerase